MFFIIFYLGIFGNALSSAPAGTTDSILGLWSPIRNAAIFVILCCFWFEIFEKTETVLEIEALLSFTDVVLVFAIIMFPKA